MGIEIERKFLVKNTAFRTESNQKKHLKQGYLNADKKRTVRIRIADEIAFITVKGESNSTGISRFEWEKEIKKREAEDFIRPNWLGLEVTGDPKYYNSSISKNPYKKWK